MNATKQASWLFFALLNLAFSCWYFASSKPIQRLDEHTLNTTANMIINHLTVRQFDTEGRLANYLKTPLLHQIPFNNTHWLKTPEIMIAERNEPVWEIHAEEATAVHNGQQITFKNHVVVHQKKDERTEESTFKTESLTYFPKDKLATTLSDVTYERPGSIVQSKGMKAYLAEKRVTLLSGARGTYEPKRG